MSSPCFIAAGCREPASAQDLKISDVEDLGPSYQYQPISAKDEIRVLHLEPGAFADPLTGSLVVQTVGEIECNHIIEDKRILEEHYDEMEFETMCDEDENTLAYECVSYCWGPQTHFTSFKCDGTALRITLAVD